VFLPLYKGKGDAIECSNYRSLKMLEHIMKILESVVERRIRGSITISDIQVGFMPEKSTVDAILSAVRQLVEKYGTVGKDLFVAFIDLEKAFDHGPRDQVGVEEKRSDGTRSEAVMEMYRETETSVQIYDKRLRGLKLKLVCINVLCLVHCYLQMSWMI